MLKQLQSFLRFSTFSQLLERAETILAIVLKII
jgi:hypothetical protein